MAEAASSFAGRASETVGSYAGDVAERARRSGEAVGSYASDAADRARRFGHDLSDRSHHFAGASRERMRQTASDLSDALDREPLVLGAIGLAVGAAIGAMLPGTRAEAEMLGETREQLRERAQRAIGDTVQRVETVAGEAMHAAREGAEREGLLPGEDGASGSPSDRPSSGTTGSGAGGGSAAQGTSPSATGGSSPSGGISSGSGGTSSSGSGSPLGGTSSTSGATSGAGSAGSAGATSTRPKAGTDDLTSRGATGSDPSRRDVGPGGTGPS
jgi:hypothetical protein